MGKVARFYPGTLVERTLQFRVATRHAPASRVNRPAMRARLLLPLALLLASCSQIGDLGPQPFSCTKTAPDCPDNYACDPQTNACEYPCPGGSACPDGLTCDKSGFCIVPYMTNDDCVAFFNDAAHACSPTLMFCVPGH